MARKTGQIYAPRIAVEDSPHLRRPRSAQPEAQVHRQAHQRRLRIAHRPILDHMLAGREFSSEHPLHRRPDSRGREVMPDLRCGRYSLLVVLAAGSR